MKATEFVASVGIERAKEVLGGAPDCGQPIYYNTINSVYFFTGYSNFYFFNGDWRLLEDTELGDFDFKAVSLKELKQVVESINVINRMFSLKQAKKTLIIAKAIGYTSDYQILNQAIADYKAIQALEAKKASDTKIAVHDAQ